MENKRKTQNQKNFPAFSSPPTYVTSFPLPSTIWPQWRLSHHRDRVGEDTGNEVATKEALLE